MVNKTKKGMLNGKLFFTGGLKDLDVKVDLEIN